MFAGHGKNIVGPSNEWVNIDLCRFLHNHGNIAEQSP